MKVKEVQNGNVHDYFETYKKKITNSVVEDLTDKDKVLKSKVVSKGGCILVFEELVSKVKNKKIKKELIKNDSISDNISMVKASKKEFLSNYANVNDFKGKRKIKHHTVAIA